jgi:hypothetical protein
MKVIYIIFMISLPFCGCAGGGVSDEKTVIWDSAHMPVFSIDSFTEFVTILGGQGLSVKSSNEVLTDVKGKALIIVGQTHMYSADEINGILKYVNGGGKVIIMTHIPPKMNLNPLLNELGFNVSSNILLNESNSTSVVADVFEKSTLTDGLNRLVFFGCYYTDNAIVKCECYADRDGDKVADREEKGEYGVVGYRKIGKGEVLVITDDALIMDGLINHADNKKFAENIAKWIVFSQSEVLS